MLTHKWTTSTFSLLMLHLTFAFCNGQTTNDLNSAPVHEQHPRIVRTSGTKSEVVHCELLDKDGNLWFSISGEGAYRYDGRSFTNLTTKDGLCDNRVAAMIQGKSGSFFLGTNNGISTYDGKKFTTIPMTDTLSITSLFEDRDGNLWFGAMNQGIFRYDGTDLSNLLWKYKHPFLGDKSEGYISDIIQDKNGNIWFSSWNGGGVWKYDGKDFEQFLPSADYYNTNQDNRRGGGKTQYSSRIFTDINVFVQSPDYISDDMIFSMTEDRAGGIWFATRSHGACRFDGQKFTGFGAKQGLLSTNTYAILEDCKGNLWFTSEKDGVWCFDGKSIKNFNEKDGLVNNSVISALEDKDGSLWFGTKWCGLSRYDGKTFTTFSRHDD